MLYLCGYPYIGYLWYMGTRYILGICLPARDIYRISYIWHILISSATLISHILGTYYTRARARRLPTGIKLAIRGHWIPGHLPQIHPFIYPF